MTMGSGTRPTSAAESLASCTLCPRACGANRAAGARGICGADGTLVVARAALHRWEEPPVSGTHGSGTVFFSHCPLRCVYCQNEVIAAGEAGVAITVDRLAEIFGELRDKGALNLNMVTPTHYATQIRTTIDKARAAGVDLPVVWNTSGYETVSAIRANAGYVNVYLADFKYASSELAARYSKAPDYPSVALSALGEMVAQVGKPQFDEYEGDERMTSGVVVRHLMLPGALEDSKRVVRTVWERFGTSVMLSLMNQYTPVIADAAASGNAAAVRALERCPELAARVTDEEYEELLDFADSLGIDQYFWQEGGAAEESFIPAFDLEGVLHP